MQFFLMSQHSPTFVIADMFSVMSWFGTPRTNSGGSRLWNLLPDTAVPKHKMLLLEDTAKL